MEYRILGKTGLRVSELGIGTWPIGGTLRVADKPFSYGDVPKKTAFDVLDIAYEMGINFFDTADFYGLGRSEYLLGEKFYNIDNVIILTKAGYVPDGEYGSKIDLSYYHIMAAAKRSLERLNRKYIDIFLLHAPPENLEQWKEASEALRDLKYRGIIKHSGISIGANFKRGIEWIKYPEIEVIEIFYNILLRDYETELLKKIRENNVGVVAASPLSRGILSETVSSQRVFDDSDVRNRWIKSDSTFSLFLERREKIKKVLLKYKVPLTGSALAFVLREKTISTVIPGMKSIQNVKQNIEEVYDYRYSKELFEELIRNL